MYVSHILHVWYVYRVRLPHKLDTSKLAAVETSHIVLSCSEGSFRRSCTERTYRNAMTLRRPERNFGGRDGSKSCSVN
jgi:hypothetical protein